MKKRLLSILLVVALASALLITGCSWNVVTSIEWSEMPQTVFMPVEATTWDTDAKVSAGNYSDYIDFKVTVTTDNPTTVDYDTDFADFKITGFDLSQGNGTYTATVKYKSYSNMTINFTYRIDNGHIGRVNNIYEIYTPEQFLSIVLATNDFGQVYPKNGTYRLMADLDFSNIDLNAYTAAVLNYEFSGTLDGGIYDSAGYTGYDHTILNFNAPSTGLNNQPGLFFNCPGATFKNFKMQNCSVKNISAQKFGLLCRGYAGDSNSAKTITVDNVDMSNCSIFGANNAALFVGCARQVNVNMKNCSADATCKVIANSGYTASTFIGSGSVGNTYVVDGCATSASIYCYKNPACYALVANTNGGTFTIKNCVGNAKLYVTSDEALALDNVLKNPLYGGTSNVSSINNQNTCHVYYSAASAERLSALPKMAGTVVNEIASFVTIKNAAREDATYDTIFNEGEISFAEVAGAAYYVVSHSVQRNGSRVIISYQVGNTTGDTCTIADGVVTVKGFTKLTSIRDRNDNSVPSNLAEGFWNIYGIASPTDYLLPTVFSSETGLATDRLVALVITAVDSNGVPLGTVEIAYPVGTVIALDTAYTPDN